VNPLFDKVRTYFGTVFALLISIGLPLPLGLLSHCPSTSLEEDNQKHPKKRLTKTFMANTQSYSHLWMDNVKEDLAAQGT